jgi:hypothetical protein
MIYDRLPSPKQIQTLVQVWKQLSFVAHGLLWRDRRRRKLKTATRLSRPRARLFSTGQPEKRREQALRKQKLWGGQSGEQKCPTQVNSVHLGTFTPISKLSRRLKR